MSSWGLGPDKGVFTTMGWLINQGERIYADAWDHKPPGIHLLSSVALRVSPNDPETTIWRVQWINSLILCALTGLAAFFWTGFAAAGILAGWILSATLYHPSLYSGGHLTGEYGSLCVLVGAFLMAGVVRFQSPKSPVPPAYVSAPMIVGSGLFFGIATLFKEPFVTDSVPFFVLGFLFTVSNRSQALRFFGLFMAGALTPYIFTAMYTLGKGVFLDWLDVYTYNFGYAKVKAAEVNEGKWTVAFERFNKLLLEINFPITLMAIIGLLAPVVRLCFKSQDRTWFLIPAWIVFAFIGATLGGRLFSHYYMQMAVPYALLVALGFAALLQLGKRLSLHASTVASTLLVLFITLEIPLTTVAPGTTKKLFATYIRRHQEHFEKAKPDPAVEYIRTNSGSEDTIWTESHRNTGIYVVTERRPASKYFYVQDSLLMDSWLTTKEQKQQRLKTDLETRMPKFLLIREQPLENNNLLESVGLIPFINENYRKTKFTRLGADIWERNP
jgi:hypothetical protein